MWIRRLRHRIGFPDQQDLLATLNDVTSPGRMGAVGRLAWPDNLAIQDRIIQATHDADPAVADMAMLILLHRPTPRLAYIQEAIDARGQPRDALQPGMYLTPPAERMERLLPFSGYTFDCPDAHDYGMGVFAELRTEAVPFLWRYLDPAVIAAQDTLIAWDWYAAHILARLGETGVVPKLLELLIQTRGQSRVQVIEDLAILKDRAAVDPLLTMLQDRDTEVQAAAIKALGELGDARALPALAQVQKQNAAPGTNPRRRLLLDLTTQAIARIQAQDPPSGPRAR